MTVVTRTSLTSPNTTKMTILIWFKVVDFNNSQPNNPLPEANPPVVPTALGAGAWPGGAGVSPWSQAGLGEGYGGGGDIGPEPNVFGDPYASPTTPGFRNNPVPLAEWGNQSNTVTFANPGDGTDGPSTSNSGIYITPTKEIILFLGGKFYQNINDVNTGPSPIVHDYAPFFINGNYSTQILAINATELDFTGWNVLVIAIDVSTPDAWPHPTQEGAVSGGVIDYTVPLILSLTQNSLISIVCNGVTHTAGHCQQVLSTTYNGYSTDDGTFTPSVAGDAQYLTYTPITRTNPETNIVETYNLAGDANPTTELFGGTEFAVPCLSGNAADYYNYANTAFSLVQVWLGQRIAPTSDNLAKFYTTDADNNIIPVDDGQAAADAFGTPDIWFVRDNVSGANFQDNQGTAGDFTLISTYQPPTPPNAAITIQDYSPGPSDPEDT